MAFTTRPIRVLHCDDVPDMRALVRFALDEDPRLELVGSAADAGELVEQVDDLVPDVVLLDLGLPGRDGLEAIPDVRSALPEVRIIVFSGFGAATIRAAALERGADAFIEKGTSLTQLRDAIAAGLSRPAGGRRVRPTRESPDRG